MRESRPYGSVRGAPSNGRPYRDPACEAVIQSPPTVPRAQNGHFRIALTGSQIANSPTGLENHPPLTPDCGSAGGKARSSDWITSSYEAVIQSRPRFFILLRHFMDSTVAVFGILSARSREDSR